MEVTFPHSSCIVDAKYWLNGQTVEAQEGLSGDVSAPPSGRARWAASLQLLVRGEGAMLEWRAFVAQMQGMTGTTEVPFFSMWRPRDLNGDMTTQRLVVPFAGGQTFEHIGLGTDDPATMTAGEDIPMRAVQMPVQKNAFGYAIRPGHFFGIGSRVYQAVYHWDDAGAEWIRFQPPLRDAVSAGDQVFLGAPRCKMRFASDGEGMVDSFINRLPVVTVNFIEAR